MPDTTLASITESIAGKYASIASASGLAVGVVAGEQQRFAFFCGQAVGAASPGETTLFEIGSITKVFTTTLLADMHLKGEVDLDDPVSKHLPGDVRLPTRKGVAVTLRHLATHTSGLPRLPANLGWRDLSSDNPYARYSVDDLYRCLRRVRLRSVPGRVSQYSNLGAGLLGHVLARAAGTDYESLVKQRICLPLGMSDTTITFTTDQQHRMAQGHSRGKPVGNWDLPTLAGAGALRSSIRDMLRFLRASIDPDSTSLGQALKLTQTIQTERQYRVCRDFGCVAPLALLGMTGLFAWKSFGLPVWMRIVIALGVVVVMFLRWPTGLDTMGLGWVVGELSGDDWRYLWHNGGTGGFASFMAFVPDEKVGVVLLANSDTEPDQTGRELLEGLRPKSAGPG